MLMANVAAAFGAAGHRVTGDVAEALLTPRARSELTALIGSTDLATLSLVADRDRAVLAQRLPASPRWHYDDRLICHPDLPYSDYCPGGNCASAAVKHFALILADRARPAAERAEAVMFLTHIVGDIHQPLHSGDNNDRGGNTVQVRLPDGRTLSLHAAWDTAFVDAALGHLKPAAAAKRWYAERADHAARWASGSADDWMAESYRRAVDVAYGMLPDRQCDRAPSSVIELSPEYVARATADIPDLLVEAGVRLAAVLNFALDPPAGHEVH